MEFDDARKIYLAIDMQNFGVGGYTVKLTENKDFTYGTLDELAEELAYNYWEASDQDPAQWRMGEEKELTVDLSNLSKSARKRAEWALDAWSHYSGISFTESEQDSDISFNVGGRNSFARRSIEDGYLDHVDIKVAKALTTERPEFGDQGYVTFLHEIGHALGLGHPGPYNFTGTYGAHALYQNDTELMSVLSYFDADRDFRNNDFWEADPVTPMAADLRALEMLYGPTKVNKGNTVYGTGAFEGGPFGQSLSIDGPSEDGGIFRIDDHHLLTIKDDGGVDVTGSLAGKELTGLPVGAGRTRFLAARGQTCLFFRRMATQT